MRKTTTLPGDHFETNVGALSALSERDGINQAEFDCEHGRTTPVRVGGTIVLPVMRYPAGG